MTLTGTGGIGKTRLAQAVARTQQAELAQGVVWVELATLTSESQLMQAIQVALQLSERQGATRLQTILDYLRAMPLLLVLDNCEHLVLPCARCVEALLSGCAHLRVLVTSRQPLGLTGEYVWRVPSLAVPQQSTETSEPIEKSSALLDYPAVVLFQERARQQAPQYRTTPQALRQAAEICRRLDGIPLAIEFAAAWTRSLSSSQILQHLDQRFSLLMGGNAAALPRQQTMEATLEWSFDLLLPAEQLFLGRLSAFSGGCSLESAEWVCADVHTPGAVNNQPILALLTGLVDKSLVVYEEQRDGVGRYRLLETTRKFAQTRLRASDGWETTLARHRDYFLEQAEHLGELWEGPRIVDAMDQMEIDYDNFRSALQFSLEDSSDDPLGERALRLAIALSEFQWRRGYYEEGVWGLQQALQHYGAPEDAPLRGVAMLNAGITGLRSGDIQVARTYGAATEEFYRRLPASIGLVKAIRIQGTILNWSNKYPEAKAIFEEGIAIAHQIGDPDNEARLQIPYGNSLRTLGDLAGARAVHTQALRHFQAASLLIDEGIARHNLAITLKLEGHLSEAKAHFQRSLEIHRRLRNRSWMGMNTYELSSTALAEGNLDEAHTRGVEALALCQAGEKNFVPLCLFTLAHVEWQRRHFAGVRSYLVEAISLNLRADIKYNKADTLIFLCNLLYEEERYTLGASLLATISASHEKNDIWLHITDHQHIEELTEKFQSALGEAHATEIRTTTDLAALDDLLLAALSQG
ncbi:MAG: tetratricopeptide repeat protein [Armatimonas sp.]